jgi:hypothetical protein
MDAAGGEINKYDCGSQCTHNQCPEISLSVTSNIEMTPPDLQNCTADGTSVRRTCQPRPGGSG